MTGMAEDQEEPLFLHEVEFDTDGDDDRLGVTEEDGDGRS